MDFLSDLVNLLKQLYTDHEIPRVKSVFFGLSYSGIRLMNDILGVCNTLTQEYNPITCSTRVKAGKYGEEHLLNLMDLALSDHHLDRVLGISAINALSQDYFQQQKIELDFSTDVLDHLDLKSDDTVGMVGYFQPMIPRIQKRVKQLLVIERLKFHGLEEFVHSNPEMLEGLDKIIITATTLVNRTLEDVLKYCKNAVRMVLLGPTASMLPDPFFKMGIDLVSGMKFLDAKRVERIICEGGGTRTFKKHAKKYTISSEKYQLV
ncbi:MAG: Rossmann-like domain-containing protein [Candidatus Helarchaeota archaeon]